MPSELLLVRHGAQDKDGSDPGLSEPGRRQVAGLAAVLAGVPLVAAYTSPRRRARETARALAGGLEVVSDERLVERLEWDGRSPWDEFLDHWRRTTDDRDHTPPWGSSSRQAGRRFVEACEEIVATHPGGVVLVVSHGGVITDGVRTLFGDRELQNRDPGIILTGVPHCSRTVLIRSNRWMLRELAVLP